MVARDCCCYLLLGFGVKSETRVEEDGGKSGDPSRRRPALKGECEQIDVTCDFWHWELEYVQHLIETRVLVGNADVGAAQDRREELEMKRNEANAGRRGIAQRGSACRVNFGSPIEKNFATKHQAAMLLGLGREILMVMKLVLASVMVLCVLCFILIMKN
ncbi:hypothetical protein ZWY2020_001691 [Hordeum vulgare]|nr:hypothetical protein ZWY2020_001691 [Hordeum vulgare]